MIFREDWGYERLDIGSDPFLQAAYALCGEPHAPFDIGSLTWNIYTCWRRHAPEVARAELAKDVDRVHMLSYQRDWNVPWMTVIFKDIETVHVS